jgi:uncharacterized protein YqgQ
VRHIEVIFNNASSLYRTRKGLFAKEQILVLTNHGFVIFVFGSKRLFLNGIQTSVSYLFDNELIGFMSWAAIQLLISMLLERGH